MRDPRPWPQASYAPMRFTPGDDTRPPLLTVTIAKEESPMPSETPPVDAATIRAHVEAGEELRAIAETLAVPYVRVRAVKAQWMRQQRRQVAQTGLTKEAADRLMDARTGRHVSLGHASALEGRHQ